jgi:hypothetical protein
MKSIGLLFLAISFAASVHGSNYAAPANAKTISAHPRDSEQVALASNVKNQRDGKPSRERRDQRYGFNKSSPRSRKFGGAAKDGLIQNKTLSDALPVRPRSAVIRPSAPTLNNMRHRGANPGVVGGPAISEGRNSGAITGPRVYRGT